MASREHGSCEMPCASYNWILQTLTARFACKWSFPKSCYPPHVPHAHKKIFDRPRINFISSSLSKLHPLSALDLRTPQTDLRGSSTSLTRRLKPLCNRPSLLDSRQFGDFGGRSLSDTRLIPPTISTFRMKRCTTIQSNTRHINNLEFLPEYHHPHNRPSSPSPPLLLSPNHHPEVCFPSRFINQSHRITTTLFLL
jgi:hypothetical protein